jgi:SH3 domain protein
MKPMRFLLLMIIVAVSCLSVQALAATSYVSDQLVLSLRETADPDSPIIGHLKTDDAVEILAEAGEFVQVATDVGTGYLRKQYLTAAKPKQFTINQLTKEVANLSQQLESYTAGAEGQQQELVQLRQTNAQLKTDLSQTKDELGSLQKKYDHILANSKDLLTIIKERDQLSETTAQLEAETAKLREENESLLTTGIIKWFLAGAGTLCFGWAMGKVSRKKRRAF